MSKETRESRPLPDLILERLALGELSPQQAEAATQRLMEEEGGEARLARLHAEDDALLARLPPRVVAEQIRARLHPPRRSLARASWLLVPAFALGLYFFIPAFSGDATLPVRPGPSDGIRVKGLNPHLRIHLQTDRGEEDLPPEALLGAGEVLQIGVIPAGRPYALVLSIDGRGQVSQHFLASGESTRLPPGGETLLPQAWELDDAPEFERFFLITSETPIESSTMMRAAANLARDPERAGQDLLPIDSRYEQTSFLVRKP
jgi:hypothetical protein